MIVPFFGRLYRYICLLSLQLYIHLHCCHDNQDFRTASQSCFSSLVEGEIETGLLEVASCDNWRRNQIEGINALICIIVSHALGKHVNKWMFWNVWIQFSPLFCSVLCVSGVSPKELKAVFSSDLLGGVPGFTEWVGGPKFKPKGCLKHKKALEHQCGSLQLSPR